LQGDTLPAPISEIALHGCNLFVMATEFGDWTTNCLLIKYEFIPPDTLLPRDTLKYEDIGQLSPWYYNLHTYKDQLYFISSQSQDRMHDGWVTSNLLTISVADFPAGRGVYGERAYLGDIAYDGDRVAATYGASTYWPEYSGFRVFGPGISVNCITNGEIRDVAIENDTLYVLSDFSITTIDATNRNELRHIGNSNISHRYWGLEEEPVKFRLAVNKRAVYLWRENGFQVYDGYYGSAVSYWFPDTMYGMLIDSDVAYLYGDSLLKVLDIANPARIREIASSSPGFCHAVGAAIRSPYMFIASSREGIYTVGISAADSFAVIGFCADEWMEYSSIQIAGNLLVAGVKGKGVQLYDISDPTFVRKGRFIANIGTPSGVVGTNVVFRNETGIAVYNFASADTAVLCGFHNTLGSRYTLIVDSTSVYVADGSALRVYDCTQAFTGMEVQPVLAPTQLALSPVHPNPFNSTTTISYALPHAGTVKLEVLDITGRLVTTLIDGVQPTGERTVVWDATSIPAGVYFARLTDSVGGMSVGKMVVVK